MLFAGFEGRRITDQIITDKQAPALFAIYGLGVLAVFSILALLYWHAYRLREDLALTPAEVVTTRVQIYRNLGIAGIGLLSTLVAGVTMVVAPHQLGLAGVVYFGITFTETFLGMYEGRELKMLEEAPREQRSPETEVLS